MTENKSNEDLKKEIQTLEKKNKSLKDTQALWEFALEGASMGTWVLEIQTDLMTIDGNAKNILESNPKTSSEWKQYIHPDDIEKADAFNAEISNDRFQTYESIYRIVTKSGETKWILGRGKTVQCDEQGEPTRTAGTICDITERMESDEKIKESQERIELALRGANLGTWDYVKTNDEYTLNKRAIEILGKDIKNESDWASILHPDEKQRILDYENEIRSAKDKDLVFASEYRIITPNGDIKWISDRGKSVEWDQDINIKRSSGTIQDITEQKQVEEKLRQSENKFRTAFKISPNSSTLTRLDDGIFADINDGFTRLLGYTQNEIVGKSSLEFNIWNDSKDRDRLIAGLKKDGLVENLKAEFKGKSGQIINGLMSASILDIENKKYILSVTQDITELKQSENERLDLEIRLQQAQKMESIGTLAGGIAHDFNNILSGIFGYSQLALTEIDNPNKVKNCITQIDKGSRRAAELVKQILTFSRQDIYQNILLKFILRSKKLSNY
jgi:PAS domain S-box-containing protein